MLHEFVCVGGDFDMKRGVVCSFVYQNGEKSDEGKLWNVRHKLSSPKMSRQDYSPR